MGFKNVGLSYVGTLSTVAFRGMDRPGEVLTIVLMSVGSWELPSTPLAPWSLCGPACLSAVVVPLWPPRAALVKSLRSQSNQSGEPQTVFSQNGVFYNGKKAFCLPSGGQGQVQTLPV